VSIAQLKDFFPEQLVKLCNENEKLDKKSNSFHTKKITQKNVKNQVVNTIEYAYSGVRKLPLETYRNILSAITHFNNVKNVSEEERKEAFKKILVKAIQFKICTIEFVKKYEQYVDNAQNS
jgi:hypothetical protein